MISINLNYSILQNIYLCSNNLYYHNNINTYTSHSIDQLLRCPKEFIKKLIAVTSCLDAVVASIRKCIVFMVNHCYAAIKLTPWIIYTGYANFANDIGKVTIFRVSRHLFKAVSYSKSISVLWQMLLKTSATFPITIVWWIVNGHR